MNAVNKHSTPPWKTPPPVPEPKAMAAAKGNKGSGKGKNKDKDKGQQSRATPKAKPQNWKEATKFVTVKTKLMNESQYWWFVGELWNQIDNGGDYTGSYQAYLFEQATGQVYDPTNGKKPQGSKKEAKTVKRV